MHARPPLHPWRGPLHFGLGLWEKRIPHLQWTLHWYYPSCRCVQTTLNVPRRYFWHHWLPQQYWPQILNIRYVLRSKVNTNVCQKQLFHIVLFRGAIAEINSYEYGCLGPQECKWVDPRERIETIFEEKLFPILARKEKFVRPIVSLTGEWESATNTTSAQTGSEVSLTFFLALQ